MYDTYCVLRIILLYTGRLDDYVPDSGVFSTFLFREGFEHLRTPQVKLDLSLEQTTKSIIKCDTYLNIDP